MGPSFVGVRSERPNAFIFAAQIRCCCDDCHKNACAGVASPEGDAWRPFGPAASNRLARRFEGQRGAPKIGFVLIASIASIGSPAEKGGHI